MPTKVSLGLFNFFLLTLLANQVIDTVSEKPNHHQGNDQSWNQGAGAPLISWSMCGLRRMMQVEYSWCGKVQSEAGDVGGNGVVVVA